MGVLPRSHSLIFLFLFTNLLSKSTKLQLKPAQSQQVCSSSLFVGAQSKPTHEETAQKKRKKKPQSSVFATLQSWPIDPSIAAPDRLWQSPQKTNNQKKTKNENRALLQTTSALWRVSPPPRIFRGHEVGNEPPHNEPTERGDFTFCLDHLFLILLTLYVWTTHFNYNPAFVL